MLRFATFALIYWEQLSFNLRMSELFVYWESSEIIADQSLLPFFLTTFFTALPLLVVKK